MLLGALSFDALNGFPPTAGVIFDNRKEALPACR